jgi:SOS-response transcriptional repressor LexA
MSARVNGERRRAEIEMAIRELTRRDGRPPTTREIAGHLGISSTGHVAYHLARLGRDGRIHIDRRTARGVRLVDAAATAAEPGNLQARHDALDADYRQLQREYAELQARYRSLYQSISRAS